MHICVCVYLSVSLLKGFQGGASCQHRARHTGLFFLNGRKKMAASQGVRGPGLPVLYQDPPAAAGCAESPSGLVTAGSSGGLHPGETLCSHSTHVSDPLRPLQCSL